MFLSSEQLKHENIDSVRLSWAEHGAAANTLEGVVHLCWSSAEELKCNLKLCVYTGKSKRAQMFILV